jgi:ribosome-associated heat shock protein Hsp15
LSEAAAASQRLDVWLWRARFHRSRALAAAAARQGVRINGRRTDKPAAALRVGDVLTFAQGGTVRVVTVTGLGERRGPAAEARAHYAEVGPEGTCADGTGADGREATSPG